MEHRDGIETEWRKHKMKDIIQAYFYTDMKNSSWWIYKQL